MESRSGHNQQIVNEAAEWFVEFREDDIDAAARARFNRWLARSPEHIRAYLEVAAFWADVPNFVAKEKIDVEALIGYAREDDNVVPLGLLALPASGAARETSAAPSVPAPPRSRWLSRPGVLAASILFACIGVAAIVRMQLSRGVYVTEVGEQRSIILEDGSNVELNAKSRIRVHFADHTRDVDLLEGQALFHVAPDKTRPFTVKSGDTRVRAVGTQFDVYRRASETTVTVVEGKVAVLLAEAPQSPKTDAGSAQTPEPIQLSAGEQVVVTPKSAARPGHVDVPTATAWTQRQLVFHGTSLGEVVEEFNRYNRKQLVVDDISLQSVRVSGVFSTTDPTSLLRFLHEQIQLVMTEKDGRILISRK